MNKLILKKLALAFALGFLPVFALGLLDVLDNFAKGGDNDWNILWSLLLGILVGALSAGLRGAVATFTDWMPTDALHGIGDNPTAVTVTKSGETVTTVPAEPDLSP